MTVETATFRVPRETRDRLAARAADRDIRAEEREWEAVLADGVG